MSKIHTINLSDAWEGTQAEGLKRCFGRPAGLGPADRVWLACESPAFPAGDDGRPRDIRLNGTSLPTLVGSGRRRADVTSLLGARNELMFIGSGVGPWPGRRHLPDELGRVWLEFEAAG